MLTFVPVKFVHPLPRAQDVAIATIVMLALWAALALVARVAAISHPELWVTAGLCAIALYFLVIGLLPERRSS